MFTSEVVLQFVVQSVHVFQEDFQVHLVVIAWRGSASCSRNPSLSDLSSVSGDVRDDHFFGIDVFVLEASVFHGALDEFDDGSGCLDGVSPWPDAALAMTDHGRPGASLALVAAPKTVGDSCRFATDVSTVGVDAENFIQIRHGFASGLVLNRTADFETVL